MKKYTNIITSKSGDALAGITVKVLNPDSTTATIYSDNGTTQIPGGVVTTDGGGIFSFYAANGRYNLQISGVGINTYTLADELLYDPHDDESSLAGKANAVDLASTAIGKGMDLIGDSIRASSLANSANGKGADLIANAAKKVASIAALKALRVPQGSDAQTVIVDGYAIAGDGGGGPFVWSANSNATDDGGTVIRPSSISTAYAGRWIRLVIGQPVTSAMFGAVGDGITDDTSALQSFCNAMTNGGKFAFTANASYKISSGLVATLTKRAILTLEGQNAILLPTTRMKVLMVQGNNTTSGSYVGALELGGLIVDGINAGTYYDQDTGSWGIYATYLRSAIIRNNIVRNLYGTGIGSNFIDYVSDINNNHVINTWGLKPTTNPSTGVFDSYGDGIYVASQNKARVVNNYIYNDLTVSNNYGRAGIVFEFQTEGCIAEGNRVHGYDRLIHLEAGNGGHVVRNNKLSGSKLMVLISGQTNCVIENNVGDNSGLIAGLTEVISPKSMIYLYGNCAGTRIINNRISTVAGGIDPVNIFYGGTGAFFMEDNTFTCGNARLPFYMFGNGGSTVRRNTLSKIGSMSLGGSGFIKNLFDNNQIDASAWDHQNVPSPGSTFQNNTIWNSAGQFTGQVLGYNAYGNLLNNIISDWTTSLITNDGTTGGNIAGNTFKRTQAGSGTNILTYGPVNRRPYHCTQDNTFVDSVAGTTTPFRPYGEAYSVDAGKQVIDGTAAPTSGYWNIRDEWHQISPAASGYIGGVNVRAGQAGTTWVASTAYTVGQIVVPTADNGHAYKCTTAGTSASTQPTWPTGSGATVTDGGVTWTEIGAACLFKNYGAIAA